MSRIKILPENIANMIAAGEVVDRPASVVKELIENSLDAQSDTIELYLKQYGKEEITIVDNGQGMSYHDALLAFERHATSKIENLTDLYRIKTLGFRGEALPSIAAVARLILTTREKGDEMGTQVILDGGKLIKVSEVGTPLGTTVQVFSLFKNIPARRKFLKSDAVELNHISQTLYQAALAHDQISFTFHHNQKLIWHASKANNLKERIQQLYGQEIDEHLLEVDEDCGSFKIHGYIGDTLYTKTNRFSQYIFVNHRFIKNPILLKAVSEGYSKLIPQERYPFCFLFIIIPSELVDVNVHPSKIEVKFSNQQEVFKKMINLIKNRLSTPRAVPKISETPSYSMSTLAYPHDLANPPKIYEEKKGVEQSYLYPKMEDNIPCQGITPPDEDTSPFFKPKKDPLQEDPDLFFMPKKDLLQLDNSFILFENNQGLVLMDQHAAHERIRYEQLQQEVQSKTTICAQSLLMPLPFRVPGHLIELAEELLTPLKMVGFEIEHFGQDTFVIKAIPLLVSQTNPQELISDIFDQLSELPRHDTAALSDALIMKMACSSAIKAHQSLNTPEMENLIKQLKKTSMPFRCPHGRPTTIKLTLDALKKLFGRT